MSRRGAPAKINLALVVGPRRSDGMHDVATVYERIDLVDDVTLERADELVVQGFVGDTIVADTLRALAKRAGIAPRWRVTLTKRIPVAAGLGGGSSDAATALSLANDTLDVPLSPNALHAIAASLGADVPFFLTPGPQLGEGDGTTLSSLDLPRDYCVLVLLPAGATKQSTREVYAAFDRERAGQDFDRRKADLLEALGGIRHATDLAALPRNDLSSSPMSTGLEQAGAFRADVSGAGPAVYGLFETEQAARSAAAALGHVGQTWVAFPAWYG